MALGFCKVMMIGNAGADPEVRYSGNGNAIANVRIATTERWKDRQSGEAQERTEWHRVTAFGKLAEIVGEYVTKGRQVYVEGTLRTDKYTDKDGIERFSTSIIASEVQLLGGNPANDGRNDGDRQRGNANQQRPQQQSQQQPARNGGSQNTRPANGSNGSGGGNGYGGHGNGGRPAQQQQRQNSSHSDFDDGEIPPF